MLPRFLALITVLIIVGTLIACTVVKPDSLSGYGSMIGGAGSVLAVLWFSAGLRYQSVQLSEQRDQFVAQFRYLKEASRREAINLARDILEKEEQRAVKFHAEISSISEIVSSYHQFDILKIIMESSDPQKVLNSHEIWLKKEGAAVIFITGVKAAAEIYLRSIEAESVDFSKEPEDFVFIYGPRFDKLPFFSGYAATARILSEMMFLLTPGRKGAYLAVLAAMAKSNKDFMKTDKLRELIKEQQLKGYPLPKIAEGL